MTTTEIHSSTAVAKAGLPTTAGTSYSARTFSWLALYLADLAVRTNRRLHPIPQPYLLAWLLLRPMNLPLSRLMHRALPLDLALQTLLIVTVVR